MLEIGSANTTKLQRGLVLFCSLIIVSLLCNQSRLHSAASFATSRPQGVTLKGVTRSIVSTTSTDKAKPYGFMTRGLTVTAVVTFYRLDVKVMYPVGIGSPSKEKNLKFLRDLHISPTPRSSFILIIYSKHRASPEPHSLAG